MKVRKLHNWKIFYCNAIYTQYYCKIHAQEYNRKLFNHHILCYLEYDYLKVNHMRMTVIEGTPTVFKYRSVWKLSNPKKKWAEN